MSAAARGLRSGALIGQSFVDAYNTGLDIREKREARQREEGLRSGLQEAADLTGFDRTKAITGAFTDYGTPEQALKAQDYLTEQRAAHIKQGVYSALASGDPTQAIGVYNDVNDGWTADMRQNEDGSYELFRVSDDDPNQVETLWSGDSPQGVNDFLANSFDPSIAYELAKQELERQKLVLNNQGLLLTNQGRQLDNQGKLYDREADAFRAAGAPYGYEQMRQQYQTRRAALEDTRAQAISAGNAQLADAAERAIYQLDSQFAGVNTGLGGAGAGAYMPKSAQGGEYQDQLVQGIEQAVRKYNLPPVARDYLFAIADIESGFGRNLRGQVIGSEISGDMTHAGDRAMGPFQFMSKTAQAYGLQDPMDPYASADAAARHLMDAYERQGDWHRAAIGHHSGPAWSSLGEHGRKYDDLLRQRLAQRSSGGVATPSGALAAQSAQDRQLEMLETQRGLTEMPVNDQTLMEVERVVKAAVNENCAAVNGGCTSEERAALERTLYPRAVQQVRQQYEMMRHGTGIAGTNAPQGGAYERLFGG